MRGKRVLVIGAGPAGLAAAVRLAEKRIPGLSVRLVHMGHHLGGKAASYTDASGRSIEHGWHMVVGFYDRMRALMRSAGVEPKQVLSSMGGVQNAYEPWSRRIHTISSQGSAVTLANRYLEYDGLPLGDRLHYGRFMAQTYVTAMSGEDLTRHDDVCFTTWALERGLRPDVSRYSLFRIFRELYFNFPQQISAYHVLKTASLVNDPKTAELSVCRGGWSDLVWGPIARHFEALGGTIEPYTLVTDWVYQGRSIKGVRVGRPDSSGHADGESAWKPEAIGVQAGSERTIDDFDWVISTIPNAVFVKMNASDERMWESSYFRRLKNLRSGATVSMRIQTRQRVLPFRGPVFGLPNPLGIAVNMTSHLDNVKPGVGSVIDFVGQEAGFESWSDERIASFTIDNFSRVPGVGNIRAADILDLEIHRNKSDFERIFLCEPGVQQFRPGPLTPFSNLVLAGDWIRNDVDLVCMEGAIASGQAAADIILEKVRER